MKHVRKSLYILLILCIWIYLGGCKNTDLLINSISNENIENIEKPSTESDECNSQGISDQQGNEEANSQDVFLLDMRTFSWWESGEYEIISGEKLDNKRRIRLIEPVEVNQTKYYIAISPYVCVVIYEYNDAGVYLGCHEYESGDIYYPNIETKVFRISLHMKESEKSLSYGQWNSWFSKLTIQLVNGNIDALINYDRDECFTIDQRKVDSRILVDYLLDEQYNSLANALWNNYSPKRMKVFNNESEEESERITLYFSSSEGDDRNSGLCSRYPKKDPTKYFSRGDINILLKCDDVFKITNTINLGSNSTMATYGSGERPVLDFNITESLIFIQDSTNPYVWIADLDKSQLYNGMANKSNCNIGQVIIDGKVNWNRLTWSSKEDFTISLFDEIGTAAWAIDWKTSKLYLWSDCNPNDSLICFSSQSHGIVLNNVQGVSIEGLTVTGVGGHAIRIEDSDSISVRYCYMHHIGGLIQTSTGARYGNAIQIWDGATNVEINRNIAAWIYDTCYTHQGNGEECVAENIVFSENIGANSFWGIEIWGDGYSKNEFKKIRYQNNIIYNMIDVTNPNTEMHVNRNGKLLGNKNYSSYRTGYTYHQMSALNMSNSGIGTIEVSGNVFWDSNRFLVILSNAKEKFPANISDNMFVAQFQTKESAMYRYAESDGKKRYIEHVGEFLDESNSEAICDLSENSVEKETMNILIDKMENIYEVD